VSGAILPIAALALWPFLRRIDEGGNALASRVALIRRVALFAPLSLASVEHLAARLEPVHIDPGTWLMREGESGDRFVIVERGHVEITQAGHLVRIEGPGAGIGEIALLEHIPRTASARAVEPVEAMTLDRASFLEAVTGHASSQSLAASLVHARLAADAPS
jgi:CRP-like cAMP-binding protein